MLLRDVVVAMLDAQGCALLTADMVLGRAPYPPTLKEACKLTGASATYAYAALRLSPELRRAIDLGSITLADVVAHRVLSDCDLDDLVKTVGIARLWSAVERATSPELPFAQAAE